MTRILTKNSAQCLNCLDILESKDRHDFVSCTCKVQSNAIIWKFPEEARYTKDNKWTQEYTDFVASHNHGIFIDGGLSYQRWGGNMKDFKSLSEYEEADETQEDKGRD